MEATVWELFNAGIAVELLVPSRSTETTQVGVRLRTFGKNLPRNKMVVAGAETFHAALIIAVEKGENGRWETLDWAARPWPVNNRGDLNILAGLGSV